MVFGLAKARVKVEAGVEAKPSHPFGSAEGVDDHLFESCADGFEDDLDEAVARIEKARAELAFADAQVAAWAKLDGTGNVTDATKNAYVRGHLAFWRDKSSKLRAEVKELETHQAGLKLLIAARG